MKHKITEDTRRMVEEIERQFVLLDREEEIKLCDNQNKSFCSSAVASYLGTYHLTPYLHTLGDIIISISKKYNLYNLDRIVKEYTIDNSRSILKNMSTSINLKGYLIGVEDHIMLLDVNGDTLVDTDPQDSEDKRIIITCNMII